MDLRSQTGFSLLESLVACALLATALLSMGYVATAATAMVFDSRVRTVATLLAIAKLEELRTTAAPADGADTVDGNGQPPAPGVTRLYDRRWSVTSITPGVRLLSVVIAPFPRGVAGREVRLTGGWTSQP